MASSNRTAIIIASSLALLDTIGEIADLSSIKWVKWLPTVILTGMLVYDCITFQERARPAAGSRTIFKRGLRTTLMTSGILIAWRILFLYVLFPGTTREVLQLVRNAMESGAIAHHAGADSFLGAVRQFFVPFALLGSFLTTMFWGLVASCIGTLFCKYRTESLRNLFSITKSNEELCKQEP
jgi:hypothetical protein